MLFNKGGLKMKNTIKIGTKMLASIFVALTMSLGTVRPAFAIPGDGTSYASCTGRYTIGYKAWGVARMWIYGCSNGYVFANVSSSTTYAKKVRITRDSPYATIFRDTIGYSLYGVHTNMIKYVRGSCYSGQGWSLDSLSGRTISYVWCI